MELLYKKFELLSKNHNTPEVKANTYKEIHDIINKDPQQTIHYLINNPTANYLKFFIGSNLNNETLKYFNSKDFNNVPLKSPNLFIHGILAGATVNDFKENDYLKNITGFIYNIMKGKDVAAVSETISHSIGFCIGDSLYKGRNTNPLFRLFSAEFTKDRPKFILGLMDGFSNIHNGLHTTREFKSTIASEAYKDWDERSKIVCMELLDYSNSPKKEEHPFIYKKNERICWALHTLYPRDVTEVIFNIHEDFVQFTKENTGTKKKEPLPVIEVKEPEEKSDSITEKKQAIQNANIKKYL